MKSHGQTKELLLLGNAVITFAGNGIVRPFRQAFAPPLLGDGQRSAT
jgi:hypothetical protein